MTFEELNDRLKKTGNRLFEAYENGDEKAKKVLEYWYNFVITCPQDPGGIGLCMAALDEWESASVHIVKG
jgi:hypothetical protein